LPTLVIALGVLLSAGLFAEAEQRVDWREIRVLRPQDASAVAGCTFRGLAQDDDMEDLLKRARKIYGDTVLMKDTMRGKDFMAEVYRCRPANEVAR
jgi:hypothetical protein